MVTGSMKSKTGFSTADLDVQQLLTILLCPARQPAMLDYQQHSDDQHTSRCLLTMGMAPTPVLPSRSISAAAAPRSHPVLDNDSWLSYQDRLIGCTFWQLFWGQEAQDMLLRVATQKAHKFVLEKLAEAKVAANAAVRQDIGRLMQETAALEQQLEGLLTRQNKFSSRRPPRAPCHLSTDDLRLQLTALQEQRSKHQETMAGLRSELAVLDSIPEGQMGRVLAGDTTIDELRASEQRLLAEVAARKERKAERQKEIEELCAQVSCLDALGTTVEQESGLREQLQEAQEVGDALQAQLDEQQQSLQISDSTISGNSNSINSLTSSSRQATTSSDSLTPGDSLSLQDSCLQENSSAVPDKQGLSPEDSLLQGDHDAVVHVHIAGGHSASAGKLIALRAPALLFPEDK